MGREFREEKRDGIFSNSQTLPHDFWRDFRISCLRGKPGETSKSILILSFFLEHRPGYSLLVSNSRNTSAKTLEDRMEKKMGLNKLRFPSHGSSQQEKTPQQKGATDKKSTIGLRHFTDDDYFSINNKRELSLRLGNRKRARPDDQPSSRSTAKTVPRHTSTTNNDSKFKFHLSSLLRRTADEFQMPVRRKGTGKLRPKLPLSKSLQMTFAQKSQSDVADELEDFEEDSILLAPDKQARTSTPLSPDVGIGEGEPQPPTVMCQQQDGIIRDLFNRRKNNREEIESAADGSCSLFLARDFNQSQALNLNQSGGLDSDIKHKSSSSWQIVKLPMPLRKTQGRKIQGRSVETTPQSRYSSASASSSRTPPTQCALTPIRGTNTIALMGTGKTIFATPGGRSHHRGSWLDQLRNTPVFELEQNASSPKSKSTEYAHRKKRLKSSNGGMAKRLKRILEVENSEINLRSHLMHAPTSQITASSDENQHYFVVQIESITMLKDVASAKAKVAGVSDSFGTSILHYPTKNWFHSDICVFFSHNICRDLQLRKGVAVRVEWPWQSSVVDGVIVIWNTAFCNVGAGTKLMYEDVSPAGGVKSVSIPTSEESLHLLQSQYQFDSITQMTRTATPTIVIDPQFYPEPTFASLMYSSSGLLAFHPSFS